MDWPFRTFETEARLAGDEISPFRAGLLFAREIAHPGLNPADAEAELAQMAAAIAPHLAAERDLSGKTAALGEYFFDQLGFGGNHADYYDPANSFLDDVLKTRRGIPISLAVLYMELARRAGVMAAGIGLPGHFIVGVGERPGETRLLLDPFNSGAPLSERDCQRLVEQSTGYSGPLQAEWLRPAAPRAIVARMLHNLRGLYARREEWKPAAESVRCLRALEPEVPDHARDLGLLLYRDGQLRDAILMLEEYLAGKPDAPDFEQVRYSLSLLAGHLGRLN